MDIKQAHKILEGLSEYLNNDSDYNGKDKIKVIAKRNIYMVDESIHANRGKNYNITKERASYLECKGLVDVIW